MKITRSEMFWNNLGHPNKMFGFPSPDRPIFFEKWKKEKIQIHRSKKQVLCFTSTRSCFNNNWYDVMSLSLINIDTTFLKAVKTFDSRVNIHSFFFFFPTDRPTITRDGAMGNETFYWDGLHSAKSSQRITSHKQSVKTLSILTVPTDSPFKF